MCDVHCHLSMWPLIHHDQFTGDAKDAADAFAMKQKRRKQQLEVAAASAAAAAAKAVAAREKIKRGRGGGVVDMGNTVGCEGAMTGIRGMKLMFRVCLHLFDVLTAIIVTTIDLQEASSPSQASRCRQ